MKVLQGPRHAIRPPQSVVRVDGQLEMLNTFHKRIALDVTPGETLAEIMGRLTRDPASARVYLVGRSGKVWGPIPSEHWRRLRPQAGQRVVVTLVPGGGSGSSSSSNGQSQQSNEKQTERLILQLVIVIVAAALTWYIGGVGGILVAAAWTMAANYALAALMPPPTPGKLKGRTGERQRALESPVLGLTGSQNRANPYGPIPVIYGAHGRYPAWR